MMLPRWMRQAISLGVANPQDAAELHRMEVEAYHAGKTEMVVPARLIPASDSLQQFRHLYWARSPSKRMH